MFPRSLRVVSLLLCLVLTLSILPVYAYEGPARISVSVTPSVSTASVGDTVDFTITASGEDISALEFTLVVPEGLSYVPNSAALPQDLKSVLGWAAADWTEETQKWTGYNDVGNPIPEGTVMLTFSCVVEAEGVYEIELLDLLPFDSDFIDVPAEFTSAPLTVSDQPAVEVVAPTITLKYPTLSFEDVIVMNVYYAAENLADVAEMGLITYREKVAQPSVDTADCVTPGYAWSDTDKLYYSSTSGIAAKDLGDVIYFAVYARLTDGTYSYTKLYNYSPKTYAYNQLKTGSAEMKALVAAMLNYGAAAQNYFNYKTDALVNADMTEEQKALAVDYSSDMINNVVLPDDAKKGDMIGNGGYTKRYPTISFEGAFCINYYFAPSAAPEGSITMYYWNQADFNAAEKLSKSNATQAIPMTLTDNGEYLAVVDGIAAKELDSGVYVAFCYSDGTTEYCSGVIGYSIGAYCKNQASKTGTLADLAASTAVYGYYAKQLFS